MTRTLTHLQARFVNPRRHWPLLLVLGGCSSPATPDNLFENSPSTAEDGDVDNKTCTLEGTFAYFLELGVEWESGTIKAGAGVVRQWLLSHRQLTPDGYLEVLRTCGSGAKGVPLGSPWFSTKAFPDLGLPNGEWIGVSFRPELWDEVQQPVLPEVAMLISYQQINPVGPGIGDRITSPAVPFTHGAQGLNDNEWPDVTGMMPFLVDHDNDGNPGMTAMPLQGPVPGAEDGAHFSNPRLELVNPPPRAGQLFMVLRTRAALDAEVVSCEPVRLEGGIVPSSLKIETRNVGCTVAGGGPCTPEQNGFIDANQPEFKSNGTSRFVGVKVPPTTDCNGVREMRY